MPNTMGKPKLARLNPLPSVLKHFRSNLAAGALVLLPIGITILILKFVYDLLGPLWRFMELLVPGPDGMGVGVVFWAALVYLVGVITAHVLGRRIVDLGHQIMEAIPVVRGIYGTVRAAVRLLATPKSELYGGVVLIDFPEEGLKSISIVTANLGAQDGEEMLAVYVPTPPTAYSGILVVMPARQVTPTQMTSDDAFKIILSNGILAKDFYKPLTGPGLGVSNQ